MKDLWARLERWANAHGTSLRLRPGAPEAEVAAAEAKLGFALPPDLRASYLAHDGQDDADDSFEFLPGCDRLQPLEAVVARWEEEVDLAAAYAPEDEDACDEDELIHLALWHPRRVPIAGNPYWDQDNTHCDLFPGPKGTSGQIITLVSECDLVVLGPSLERALSMYLAALESGAWIFDAHLNPPRGRVHHKDEPEHEWPNTSYEFSEWVRTRA